MSVNMTPKAGPERIQSLEEVSLFSRATALETIINADSGHIGRNLSSVELLTAMYFGGHFNFDPTDPDNENRDRILIRGHEGPIRYTIFSLMGYIQPEELETYRSLGSRLQGHEEMDVTPGVDITPSGSLGMLLSYGVGSALANKDKGLQSRTIVFLGDGEEQEGNVSEAARHAASLNLDNLICIVDQNQKQLSRPTSHSDGNTDLRTVWEGYGWKVLEIEDGHDLNEILDVYEELQHIDSPTMVIAHTVKGMGVDGAAEHFSGYHTLSAVPDKRIALSALQRMKRRMDVEGITRHRAACQAIASMSIASQRRLWEPKKVDPALYDIRTTESGVVLEAAQEDYMTQLRWRVAGKKDIHDLYFVTPDLLRTDHVEEAGFEEFGKYIDCGIREQHAIAMCHGISVENPDARIYVTYGDAFAYRALDQINAAVTGGSNIMIVGENAGLFQGQNGSTHQSVAQPNALMGIPDLAFYEPADAVDLCNVYSDILMNNRGVSYVRFHRGKVTLEREKEDLQNTDGYFVHRPDKEPQLIIMSSGYPAENSVIAARSLEAEHGIPTAVVNVVNQKRLGKCIDRLIYNDAPIVTVYNGSPQTLLASVSSAILGRDDIPRPIFMAGHGYEKGTSGKVDDVITYFGLDAQGIQQFCLSSLLARSRAQ